MVSEHVKTGQVGLRSVLLLRFETRQGLLTQDRKRVLLLTLQTEGLRGLY